MVTHPTPPHSTPAPIIPLTDSGHICYEEWDTWLDYKAFTPPSTTDQALTLARPPNRSPRKGFAAPTGGAARLIDSSLLAVSTAHLRWHGQPVWRPPGKRAAWQLSGLSAVRTDDSPTWLPTHISRARAISRGITEEDLNYKQTSGTSAAGATATGSLVMITGGKMMDSAVPALSSPRSPRFASRPAARPATGVSSSPTSGSTHGSSRPGALERRWPELTNRGNDPSGTPPQATRPHSARSTVGVHRPGSYTATSAPPQLERYFLSRKLQWPPGGILLDL